jgi:hypothetical protein
MIIPIVQQGSVRLFMCALVGTVLFAGPVILSPTPDGSGLASARDLGRLKDAGGGKKARAQKPASRMDRKPRASSANKGSMKRAAAERPTSRQKGFSREQKKDYARKPAQTGQRSPASAAARDKPFARNTAEQSGQVAKRKDTAKQQRPSMASSGARDKTFARDAAGMPQQSGKPKQKLASAGQPSGDTDLRSRNTSRQQNKEELRKERNTKVKEGREEYKKNKEEIREDRKNAVEELQQNKFDQQDKNREDWQDYMDDARDERIDAWEDIYDDRRYWGDDRYYRYDDDDDDDNGWLWGIGGAVIGGVAGYAIGAAVNEPPDGTVAVPVNGVPYQYYGGAFYEPAPSGTGYVTTPAPVGAEVEAPPIDCTIVFGPDDEGYCYFQGAFFIYDESSDQYVVVEPPAGTSVTYLPPGYEEVELGDTTYMKLGPTYYRPYYEGDDVVYVVSKV